MTVELPAGSWREVKRSRKRRSGDRESVCKVAIGDGEDLAGRKVCGRGRGGCSGVAQLEEVKSVKTSGSRVSSVEINIANLVACFRLRHTLAPTTGTSHIALFISACRRGGPLSGSRAILGMFED
jgi:hypothetical protein